MRKNAFMIITLVCTNLITNGCGFKLNNEIPSLTATTTPMIIETVTSQIKPTPDAGWRSRWLRSIPCRAPCFNGVTPGKTTANEAVGILNASDVAMNATAQLMQDIGGDGYVTWSWISNGNNNNDAHYESDDNVITLIRPDLGTIRLHDIIAAYGEPTHIRAKAQFFHPLDKKPNYTLAFTWLNDGFQVDIAALISVKPVLTDTIEFNKIVFFDPVHPSADVGISSFTPWHGMTSFDDYCSDRWEGRACGYKAP